MGVGRQSRAADRPGLSSAKGARGTAEDEFDWATGFLRPDAHRAYHLVAPAKAQGASTATTELIAETRKAAESIGLRADPPGTVGQSPR